MTQRPKIDEETILQRYESLPPDVKDALIGITSADAIYEIGKKAGLTIEQIGVLAEEIGLITLGFVPAANFISDLKSILDIQEEKAGEIARETNDRVFLPIRESLKRIHGASWADGLTKPPAKLEDARILKEKQISGQARQEQETKAMPTEQKQKEPLVISPLRDMQSPAQKPLQQTAPTIPTRPWETQRTPTAPAISKAPQQEVKKPALPQGQPTRVPPPPIRDERTSPVTAPPIGPSLPRPAVPQMSKPGTPPPTAQPPIPQKITVPFTQRIEFTQKPPSPGRSDSPTPPLRPMPTPQTPTAQRPQPSRPPSPQQPQAANPPTFLQDIESRNKNNLEPPFTSAAKPYPQKGEEGNALPHAGPQTEREPSGKKPVPPPVRSPNDDPYREPVE